MADCHRTWLSASPEGEQARKKRKAERERKNYRPRPLSEQATAKTTEARAYTEAQKEARNAASPGFWIAQHLNWNGKGCLIYPFMRDRQGYAITRETKSVPRIICERVNGAPPTPAHEAAHLCGNGSGGCVNPQHICWRTRKENMSHKLVHRTNGRKLRAEDVFFIRHSHEFNPAQWPPKRLAEELNISENHVTAILRGEVWAYDID